MQDETKEFEDEQMQRDNHAEFLCLVAAYRDTYPAYSPTQAKNTANNKQLQSSRTYKVTTYTHKGIGAVLSTCKIIHICMIHDNQSIRKAVLLCSLLHVPQSRKSKHSSVCCKQFLHCECLTIC